MSHEDFMRYGIKTGKEISHIVHNQENYTENKREGEEVLEKYRQEHCSLAPSRLNSIFVFPNDKVDERALHWTLKYVFSPGTFIQCMLITAEVDEGVQWHDATYFEDICHLKANELYAVSHRNMNVDNLCKAFWESNNIKKLEAEGLVSKMKVIEIEPCCVSKKGIPEREN